MKYIFEIHIKPNYTIEEYVSAWKRGSDIIQQLSPGAEGTRLYRKRGEDNTLLAIATWESKEARDSAMNNLSRIDDQTRRIVDRHKDLADLTPIGAFDDTEWVVMPPESLL